jgi:hypothetical protein
VWDGYLGVDGLEDDSVRALAEDLALLVAIRQELPSCIVVPAAAVAGARHGGWVTKHLRLTPGGRRCVQVGRRRVRAQRVRRRRRGRRERTPGRGEAGRVRRAARAVVRTLGSTAVRRSAPGMN